MLRSYLNIPANTPAVHGDVNCRVPSPVPLHLFAYRTHAHALSPVITGYVYNEAGHQYREIARGSPQWPQAFYPMKQVQTVRPGDDILAARCTYNSTGVDHATNIGATAGDEMCNLYIMFFSEPGKVADFLGCTNEQEGEDITRGLPADSDQAPERRPEMEAHAHDLHAAGGPAEINYAKLFEEEQEASTSKKKGGLDSETTTFRIATFNMTMPGKSCVTLAILICLFPCSHKTLKQRVKRTSGSRLCLLTPACLSVPCAVCCTAPCAQVRGRARRTTTSARGCGCGTSPPPNSGPPSSRQSRRATAPTT